MENKAALFQAKLLQYRQTGTHGTRIRMHRALRHISLSPTTIFSIIVLPVFFDALLWTHLDTITQLWGRWFGFWIGHLQPDAHVAYASTAFLGRQLDVPYPDLMAALPSKAAVQINLIAALLILLPTGLISKKYLPVTYLLRAAILIQISSSVYFMLRPDHLPYAMGSYVSGMLSLGLYLMLLTSPLLALIYYIFDFPVWRKFMVTATMIGYFLLVLPMQYMLHALIMSKGSMLFMPLLYLLFGALLNILMFVSCYALAMTWRAREKNSLTP